MLREYAAWSFALNTSEFICTTTVDRSPQCTLVVSQRIQQKVAVGDGLWHVCLSVVVHRHLRCSEQHSL